MRNYVVSVRPWFHCQNRETHGKTAWIDRYDIPKSLFSTNILLMYTNILQHISYVWITVSGGQGYLRCKCLSRPGSLKIKCPPTSFVVNSCGTVAATGKDVVCCKEKGSHQDKGNEPSKTKHKRKTSRIRWLNLLRKGRFVTYLRWYSISMCNVYIIGLYVCLVKSFCQHIKQVYTFINNCSCVLNMITLTITRSCWL